MSKCLRKDCQVELVNIEGRRPKVFCSSRCRSLHWVKEKTLESKTKRIPIEEWENLTAELNELRKLKDNRNNPLINAARGRDESGINTDEVKKSLLEQIEEIKKEKIPSERDTTNGRKVWQNDQSKRIQELKLSINLL